jgi:hypothetical protein
MRFTHNIYETRLHFSPYRLQIKWSKLFNEVVEFYDYSAGDE